MKHFCEVIRHYYPELHLTDVIELESGQNNVLLQVNSEIIFRFPKYAEGINQLAFEAQFLNRVGEDVSLAVPRPIYQNVESTVGQAFIGYKKIGGEPLIRDILEEIKNEHVLRRLAGQLGLFLNELHSIPAADIAQNDENGYLKWAELYERIQTKLYPFMSRQSRQWTDKHFFKLS